MSLTFVDTELEVPGLILMLFSDGTVAVKPRIYNFFPEWHYGEGGVVNVFATDGFSLSDADGILQHFEYDVSYPYKEMPSLKRWLIEQKLQYN